MKKNKDIVDMDNHRYGLFMSEESNELSIMYGREYLQSDNVQEIILHKINVIETKSHNLYGQAKSKDKRFMKPVKLKIMISTEEGEQSYYGSTVGGIVREDIGKLIFNIYLKELEENNVEIDRGDIIQYNLSGFKNRYYEVENAENVTDKSQRSMGGFFSYWKKVTSIPVKEDAVTFLSDTKGTVI